MLNTFFLRVPVTVIGTDSSKNIGDIATELGATNALIITDSNLAKAGLLNNVESSLEKVGCKFDTFDGCMPGAPSGIVEKCSQVAKKGDYDLLIGVGGGSVLDTVKAVSVMVANDMSFHDFVSGKVIDKVLPKVLIPTTAGTGSEWSRTGVYHDDEDGEEKLVFDRHLFANAAIVDPELTLGLPQRVTADTGMDALTHAIESYISPKANIISSIFAESAIKLISDNLRLAYAKGSQHPEARYKLSVAASMAMGAATSSSTGMAHILSSEVTRRAHITHGEVCILLLPHTMEFNLIACTERLVKIAQMMGEQVAGLHVMDAAQTAIEAVKKLSRDVGMPQKLSELGITENDIDGMAEATIQSRSPMIQANNPRLVTRQDIVQIYTAAL